MRNIIYLFCLLEIMACETVVDIEIPTDKPKLVAFSLLNPDSTIKIVLNKSRFILDESQFQPVDNGIVKIVSSGNETIELENNGSGIYISNLKPSVGKFYALEVEAPGFESVNSSTSLPEPVEINQVELEQRVVVREQNEYYPLYVEFKDPPEENYYQVVLYSIFLQEIPVWDYPDSFRVEEFKSLVYIEAADPIFDDEFDYDETLLIEDATFNGRDYRLQLLVPRYTFEYWDSNVAYIDFQVELYHLSKDYFLFEKTSRLQNYNEDNPFAEPVPVFGNIENGMGLFSSFNIDVESFRYER